MARGSMVLEPFDSLVDEARTQALRKCADSRRTSATGLQAACAPALALERFSSLSPAEGFRARRGLSIPASMLLHGAAAVAIGVLPLLVSESLPVAEDGVRAFFVEPMSVPAPPPPPPPAPARSAAAVPRAVVRTTTPVGFTAPVEVPTEIVPEAALDLGIEGGVPGGVEGGVPGGVVGGVVAALPEAPPPPPVKAVRVGGAIRPPRKVVDVPAVYPELGLRAQVQGTVIIEATIDERGRVQNATVLRSIPILDDAALAAVRQWVYTPTLLNGVPTPVVMTVTVTFLLRPPAR